MKKSKMEDNENDESQIHLPDDLIVHYILPWQPIKPLAQYKLLSKQWYFSLSSPNFILNYTNLPLYSHPIPPIKSLFIQSGNSFYLYSCDNLDDNVVEVDRNTEDYLIKLNDYDFDVGNDVVNLVGSCNGLVCLGEIYGNYFILWNPSANQSHKYFSEVLDTSSCDWPPHIRWGFGYVSSMDDYKVVRLIQYQIGLLVDTFVHVFSLRANTWKKIEFDLVDCSYVLIERPRLVNETLYWTASRNPYGNMKIVAFDIASETFDMFPHLAMLSPLGVVLCVMGGCLSKCVVRYQNEWVIDIVRGPGRVYPLHLNCDLGRFDDLIGFTMSNKVLVAYTSPNMLGLVDLSLVGLSSKESLVKFRYEGRTRIESYVTSQISPHP
ncbi:F-box/kelch-repeat protein At3g23880-like [Chenopodium quinoa]|uniref:F-box/kelch-repeat protein At3g23880-like n=1 Tax=Chenopodium quinoa TaxID=63459 RepID=UPI000B799EA2|nr:F-box/kelch-repeat protein At3g23880-like [Chenopodium quinoa]